MIINIIIFLAALILLVKGSDSFVKSAAEIARKFKVSEFFIGLTLIAVGTSLPELMSAIFASVDHESGLIMGNIVGANIANIGLIIGIAAIIGVINIKKEMLNRDGFFLIFVAILLITFTFNGQISRIEGSIFLALYLAYVIFLFESSVKYKEKYHFKSFIPYFLKFHYLKTIKNKLLNHSKNKKNGSLRGILKKVIKLILSATAVIFGAKYVVESAVFFANVFKVPQTVIGIIIAIGTTMPEMSVAITAIKKGYGNIIIGNAIGSCITNTLLILGIASLIFPVHVTVLSRWFTIPFMLIMTIMLVIFMKSNWKITRKEGIVLLLLYLLFLGSVLFYF